MSADVRKLPVEPVDRTLFECPDCKAKFKREPFMPLVFTSPDVKVVMMKFAFDCPFCGVEIHVTFPSEREKAPVVPIKRKT